MKRLAFTILALAMLTSGGLFAASVAGWYNLSLDENDFVVDFTSWPTALPYERHFIKQPLPPDLMNGCYRFDRATGLLTMDEAKYAEYRAAIAASASAAYLP